MPTNLLALGGLALVLTSSFLGLKVQPQRAATLSRIAALDSCLATTNRQRADAARIRLGGIKRAVARHRNQAADVGVGQQAQQIHASTQAPIDTLQHLRRKGPATGSPAALVRLATQASQYADFRRLYVPESVVLAESTPAGGRLGGPGLQQLPTPATGAALTRREAQVWQVAAEALAKQAMKVGSRGCDLCFDKINVFAIPASNTVEPGALCKAKRADDSSIFGGFELRMQANGRALEVDPRTTQGLVSFRVPAAHPGQPATVRAQWHGQIRYNFSRTDTVQPLIVPYYIVKRARP